MFGSWRKRRAQLNAVRDATADLERFVLSLKGQSADELGMLVAIAAVIRMNMRQEGRLPDEALGVGVPLSDDQQDAIQANMSRLTREWQKMNQPTDAAGGMVWLHSLRASRYPEVRLLGRQMWGELQRGFPTAFQAFDFIEKATQKPLPLGCLQASQFIPVGLEPFEKGNPASEVGEHLKMMGYDLTPYGAAVALLQVQSGYSPVEAASHIALTTMALDIKGAERDFVKLMGFYNHAITLIKVLREYRDKKMMRDSIWQNDTQALYHIARFDLQSAEWIGKILSDPIAGKERLANTRRITWSDTDDDITKRCTAAMTSTAEFLKVSLGQCPDDIQQQLNALRFHALVAFQFGAMVEAANLYRLTVDHARASFPEILKMVNGISEGMVVEVSKRVAEMHARNFPPIAAGGKAFTEYCEAGTDEAQRRIAAQRLWSLLKPLTE